MERLRKTMDNRWNKLLLAMMVIFISGGCVATQSEIRTNEPYFTLTSTKPSKGLAKCIEQKMAAEAGAAFIVNFEEYPDGTCRVPLIALPNFAIADILVKPT